MLTQFLADFTVKHFTNLMLNLETFYLQSVFVSAE